MFKQRHRACRRCGDRWPQQGLSGYCRRCARELGDIRSTKEREAAVLRQRLAQLAHLPRALPPAPPRTVIVQGVEYEVVAPRY